MSEAFLLQVGTYLIGGVSGTWQLEQRPDKWRSGVCLSLPAQITVCKETRETRETVWVTTVLFEGQRSTWSP